CDSKFRNADESYVSQAIRQCYESGVLGCVCRHNLPLEFTNIVQSGEKHKYPLSVIDVLMKKHGTKVLKIMYDIGCHFEPAIKENFPDWVGNVAVGVFHAYAHSMDCQVQYNPRLIEGFGLTDGE
ncbi:hypothetical protein BDB00DRAFT_721768, partial [Zychaea mexicana]|uniref:uncharacterized protein n=1 Tax=Zychaea mexicana TaxID=64656 RepID=UPI0022FED42E